MNKKQVNPDTPGARVRALRIANGLSQKALAKKIGVTQGAVSQFELGNTTGLKHNTFLAMVRVLQTNAQYIFKGQKLPGDGTARESVSLDERELLHYWRNLDPDTQLMVMAMVRSAVKEHKPSIADPFLRKPAPVEK